MVNAGQETNGKGRNIILRFGNQWMAGLLQG
jgi:hypothetical protein